MARFSKLRLVSNGVSRNASDVNGMRLAVVSANKIPNFQRQIDRSNDVQPGIITRRGKDYFRFSLFRARERERE
jgi:hypothetical protein